MPSMLEKGVAKPCIEVNRASMPGFAGVTRGLCLAALILLASVSPMPARAAGNLLPAFSLKDTHGQVVTNEQIRGRRVFLDVWAIWCAPCLENMPKVEALSDAYRGSKKAAVVSVHYGDDYGRYKDVADFLRINHYNVLVLLDDKRQFGKKISPIPGVVALPRYLLIDENGRIVRRFSNLDDKSMADVRQFLGAAH